MANKSLVQIDATLLEGIPSGGNIEVGVISRDYIQVSSFVNLKGNLALMLE